MIEPTNDLTLPVWVMRISRTGPKLYSTARNEDEAQQVIDLRRQNNPDDKEEYRIVNVAAAGIHVYSSAPAAMIQAVRERMTADGL